MTCGAKYELLVDDVKNWKRCVKCDATISKCGAFDGDEDGVADRCVECADDHVMPWQKNEPEWPCDCCGNETADVVPSVDYDNSLAEELQCVLCEPCWKRLRDIPFEEAKTKLRKLWRTARNYERNDER